MAAIAKQAVLVVGATGNIGVSVIIAALRRNMDVLAVIRNKSSADKITRNLNPPGENLPTNNITMVEADVTSDGDNGVKGIVEKVKKGELPGFQHVYSTVGMWHNSGPFHETDMTDFRRVMKVNLESNFFAYKYTIPYLLSLSVPTTFTLITGGAGTLGVAGVTAVSQGALFSLSAVAARELRDTNARFNEVYLSYRVDYDDVVDKLGKEGAESKMRASEFARVYQGILDAGEGGVKGMRVSVLGKGDLDGKNVQAKI